MILARHYLFYASDGREAIDWLRDHPDIDFVLLNEGPFDTEGFFFELRALGNAPPVIAVTLPSQTGTIDGADAIIELPFDEEQLLAKIEKLPRH